MSDLTAADLDLLRHAIDIDKDASLTGEPWRNRYAAAPSSDAAEAWDRLVASGHALRGAAVPGGLIYYAATDSGIRAARDDERKLRAASGLRLWDVTVRFDGGSQTTRVLARSAASARWDVVRDIIDGGLSVREALSFISGVRLA